MMNSGMADESPHKQEARQNGLHVWRTKKKEERERVMAELEELRKNATIEVRDGREFKVLRIPDRYGSELLYKGASL